MPKSRRRKVSRKKASGAGLPHLNRATTPVFRRRLVWAAVLGVLLVAGVYGYDRWRASEARGQFEALLRDGKGSLDGVKSSRSRGQAHLAPGQRHGYGMSFPTSGPHDPVPTSPGFYDDPQPPEKLVHAIEHGHIVVYYDEPGEAVMTQLKDWSRLFRGHWDGFVAVPYRGLKRKLVLTAWRKRLDLEPFDAPSAVRFIDAYRGRGPENPVR
jgi:hypothetical protein